MSNYIVSNNRIRIVPDGAINITNKIPMGTYTVEALPPTGELVLQHTDPFKKPNKIYGEVEKQASRIIKTFEDRVQNTGVMLQGEKGSGKTFLAKYISHKMAELNYPTILINDQYDTVMLSQFIQNITEPCLIIFDEFEKIYIKNNDEDNKDPQTGLLTLLDGLLITKKLFIFTCNDCYKVTTMMKNRPGRIYYTIDFGGLSEAVIKMYCNENLKDKKHIEEILSIKKLFGNFTFDMLKALVEEINRYDENPLEAVKLLNIIPETNGEYYGVEVFDVKTGKEYDNNFKESDDELYGSLFKDRVGVITIWENSDRKDRKPIKFGVKDFVQQIENQTIYVVDGKYKIVLSQKEDKMFGNRKLWKYTNPSFGD